MGFEKEILNSKIDFYSLALLSSGLCFACQYEDDDGGIESYRFMRM